MSAETMTFQAETARLLHLVATALYSNKEVFIRELVSNAADACDKLRFLSQSDASLMTGDDDLKVTISLDEAEGTLTFSDTGIGMSREELIDNLGTIAKSGTAAFAESLQAASTAGDESATSALIGQFGVGFYSAFVVADRVEVTSRKAGTSEAHQWTSDGQGSFQIAAVDAAERGTSVCLWLKEDAAEFKQAFRVRSVIERYADHIAIPVFMLNPGIEDGDADTIDQVNKAEAIWRRSKDSVTDEQYTEHYRGLTGMFDQPWDRLHLNAEGALEYSALVYIPSSKPYDLFNPERKTGTKLYVKRVFITDECEELMPPYLRFVRGIVDSEDLPLNVSRELLQSSPILNKMKDTLTKRVLGLLDKRAKKDADAYNGFFDNFGAVLKEGLYEDFMARDKLLPLVRFKSSASDGEWTSLADYVSRMKDGQDKIYYITADSLDAAATSAHLEGFTSRGLEVLYAVDAVDAFWMPTIGSFEDKEFASVTQGSSDLSNFDLTDEAKANKTEKPENIKEATDVIARLKTVLAERVSDVRLTDRLSSSAVCIVAGEGGVDRRLEKILSSHQQPTQASQPILEINPSHTLIRKLADGLKGENGAAVLGEGDWERWSHLLFDLALIQEGELPDKPAQFARELQTLIAD